MNTYRTNSLLEAILTDLAKHSNKDLEDKASRGIRLNKAYIVTLLDNLEHARKYTSSF